jgi:hypothetical protein
MLAVIERVKLSRGIGTVVLRNMIQKQVPEANGKHVREWLLSLRKRQVLDYRDGRWFYVKTEDRKLFMTALCNRVLKTIPWVPDAIAPSRILKAIPGSSAEEIQAQLRKLYHMGKIKAETRHFKLPNGKRTKYRVYFRLHKGDS